MDEKVIQKVRSISYEIVKNEFPDEEEYFDFLFDLTMQEIKKLEPGKEAEFLREIRAIHPELILGYTPIIIILTVQVLTEVTHREISGKVGKEKEMKKLINEKIRVLLKDENNKRKLSGIFKHF